MTAPGGAGAPPSASRPELRVSALVALAMAAFITVVYGGLVLVLPGLLPGGDGPRGLGWSVAATVVVAALYPGLRRRVRRQAGRLVYGDRATPYEVMAQFARRVSQALSVEEVLPRLAEAAARGCRAERSAVRLLLPGGGERRALWPAASPDGGFDGAVPVRHGGETVGEIAVAKGDGTALSGPERELLGALAAQAGLAVHNARLTAELEARLREISVQERQLQESRLRLVTARVAERRRVERSIDRAVEQELRAAVRALGRARRAATDPARTDALLATAAASAVRALEALRQVAHGVFPPLLADRGLAAAVEAHAGRNGLGARVRADAVTGSSRFAMATESAVYLCCVEAVAGAGRGPGAAAPSVDLASDGAWVAFEVAGCFAGGPPPGLEAMGDRVEGLGGTLAFTAGEDGLGRLQGRVPAGGR